MDYVTRVGATNWLRLIRVVTSDPAAFECLKGVYEPYKKNILS